MQRRRFQNERPGGTRKRYEFHRRVISSVLAAEIATNRAGESTLVHTRGR